MVGLASRRRCAKLWKLWIKVNFSCFIKIFDNCFSVDRQTSRSDETLMSSDSSDPHLSGIGVAIKLQKMRRFWFLWKLLQLKQQWFMKIRRWWLSISFCNAYIWSIPLGKVPWFCSKIEQNRKICGLWKCLYRTVILPQYMHMFLHLWIIPPYRESS